MADIFNSNRGVRKNKRPGLIALTDGSFSNPRASWTGASIIEPIEYEGSISDGGHMFLPDESSMSENEKINALFQRRLNLAQEIFNDGMVELVVCPEAKAS